MRRQFAALVVPAILSSGGCGGGATGTRNVHAEPDTGADDSDAPMDLSGADCRSSTVPAGVCVVRDGWHASVLSLSVSGVVARVGESNAGEACVAGALPSPTSGDAATGLSEAPWFELDDGGTSWVIGVQLPGAAWDVLPGDTLAVSWSLLEEEMDLSPPPMSFSVTDAAGAVAMMSEWTQVPIDPPGFSSIDGPIACHTSSSEDTGASYTSRFHTFTGPSGTSLTLAPGETSLLDGYVVGAPANVRESDDRAGVPFTDKVVAFVRAPTR